MSTSANPQRVTFEGLQNANEALDQMKRLLSARDPTTLNVLQDTVSDLRKLEILMSSARLESQLNAFRGFLDSDSRLEDLNALVEEQQGGFDLFKVLGIQEQERVHSNFLAWLLNPRANDAIENFFLENFLERTIAAARELDISTVPYGNLRGTDWSETEVFTEWNYIDILVLNRKARFVCAIENKINADEGFDEDGRSQLARYRETLAREFPDFDSHRVFLSPQAMASGSIVERKFWVPESYSNILELVVETRDRIEDTAKPEVFWSLSQYESTLRRNIVPETGEIAKLASQIYLEHREAIELIYQHRPNYQAVIKQVLREAISQQESWKLDMEDNSFLRFRPIDWDRFEIQRSGNGWGESPTLLLFELYCPSDPTQASGLHLVLGPGSDENIRQELFETAKQNPKVFKLGQITLAGRYSRLHDRGQYLLNESELGTRWADGSANTKITEMIERFARDEFPLINEAIIGCFEEYEANLTQ